MNMRVSTNQVLLADCAKLHNGCAIVIKFIWQDKCKNKNLSHESIFGKPTYSIWFFRSFVRSAMSGFLNLVK